MKPKWSIIFLCVILCLGVLAGCKKEEPAVVDTGTPAPSVSPSASATATPTATPSATPTEIPTPIPDIPPDIELGEGFKSLAKKTDLVVRGKYTSVSKDIWNQVRDMNDPDKGDENYYIGEYQYTFEITEVYQTPKNKKFKVGDKIVVNLAFEERMGPKAKVKTLDTFVKPELEQDYVLFLALDKDSVPGKDIYYPDTQPAMFEVKDSYLFAKVYNDTLLKSWNKTMKLKEGKGAPLSNLKKDLGIK